MVKGKEGEGRSENRCGGNLGIGKGEEEGEGGRERLPV